MKSKKKTGLGKSLMRSRFATAYMTNPDGSTRHTTDLDDGASWTKYQSVTEENDLEAFLNTAQLAGTEFTAERMHIEVISKAAAVNPYLLTPDVEKETLKKHEENKDRLTVPRRPKWDESTTPEELQKAERESFLDWRRRLVFLEEDQGLLMTPYERNLEVWRQLWRVIERSDLVVQIVDARNPLLFRSTDLEKYVKEVDPTKRNLLLVNKADMLTVDQRVAWADWFKVNGIPFVFFSAALAKLKQEMEGGGQDKSHPTTSKRRSLKSKGGAGGAAVEALERRIADKLQSKRQRTTEVDEDEYVSEDGEDGDKESNGESENVGDDEDGDEDDEIVDGEVIDSDGDEPPPSDSDSEFADEEADDDDDEEDGRSAVTASTFTPPAHVRELDDGEHDAPESVRIMNADELIELLMREAPRRENADKIQVGFVGYPNVGKSSTLNALVGAKRVAVAATPGKTKHFQTIHLSDEMILCDCPGLVFPSFATTKADMVVNGILPVDQLREHTGPAALVASRIPRHVLEATYGIRIRVRDEEGVDVDDRQPTAEEMLQSYAIARGFRKSYQGNPDEARAARYMLKDYINGKLLFCTPPPTYPDPKEFNEPIHNSEKFLRSLRQTASSAHDPTWKSSSSSSGQRPKQSTSDNSTVDKSFFKAQEVQAHTVGKFATHGFDRVRFAYEDGGGGKQAKSGGDGTGKKHFKGKKGKVRTRWTADD
ncbi:hypothetical protein BJ742DRAFT_538517 [Cladochytrium replicatum]|nr:hypothetical protein BJ742DRAFT_538517 [Cladochytrium replicatum]